MLDTTVIPKKIDTAIDNIDWDAVIQEGAESLAQGIGSAFGAAVGGPIGGFVAEAFVSALLGNGQDQAAAMHKEIINHLKAIEHKLDLFIDFVKSELPEIIRNIVNDELLKQIKIELDAHTATAAQVLAIVNHQKILDDASKTILAGVTLSLSELGIRLLKNGKEYVLGALHAYSMALACYHVLVKYDKTYINGLALMSGQYSQLLRPMLDDSPAAVELISFMPVLRRLQTEYASAEPFQDAFTGTYITSFTSTYEGDAMGPFTETAWACYSRFIINNDNVLEFTPMVKIQKLAEVAFAADGVTAVDACPWYSPRADTTGRSSTTQANEAFNTANRLWSFLRANPKRTEFVSSSIDISKSFLHGCQATAGEP